MSLLEQLEADLKKAMLARDEVGTSTIRSIKSAITYAIVDDKAKGGKGELTDEQIQMVLVKESKKRQDSADAFNAGGAPDRADKELAEKLIIDKYLPEQLSDEKLKEIVDKAIAEVGASDARAMGQVIGKVKAAAGGQADGARIAQLVREGLNSK